MSTCSSGGTSVSCEGGCGVFCSGGHCSAWCEPVSHAVVTVGPAVIRSSDEVTLCTKDLTADHLLGTLEELLGARLSRSRERDELASGTVSFTGSVAELLEYLGLREADEASSA